MARDPRRIAIFRVGHLGDTLVAMPAFWTVRKRFPEAHILYLNQWHGAGKLAQGAEVLKPGIIYDEIMSYTLGSGGVSKFEVLKTALRLRLKRIELLAYLAPYKGVAIMDRDARFFRLAGVKRIAGMNANRSVDHTPRATPLPTVIHETDRLLKSLEQDGITIDEPSTSLLHIALDAEERAFAKQWIHGRVIGGDGPLVAIGPGSKMPAKLWSTERFIEVAQRAEQEFRARFVLLGSGAERNTCQRICDSVRAGTNAAGEVSVRQSAAILEHCQAYLGNDTGTMHIAASVGVKCVAVFAARDWPGRWHPYGIGHKVHRSYVPCEGCMLEVCDRDNLCLVQVRASDVFDSLAALLT